MVFSMNHTTYYNYSYTRITVETKRLMTHISTSSHVSLPSNTYSQKPITTWFQINSRNSFENLLKYSGLLELLPSRQGYQNQYTFPIFSL